MAETLTIARRFCGPPDSANGGYACGLVAVLIGGNAEVTLRKPPPLDRARRATPSGDGIGVYDADQLVAEAKPATVEIVPPPAPSFAQASAAVRRFPGWQMHPFPTCFVCGTKRTPGDGLCIHPGLVEDAQVAAAPFTPDASLAGSDRLLRPEMVWAALDCPSWFGFQCTQPHDVRMALLGRLAVRIDARPRTGERCVVTGWLIGRDGRKIHCGSALFAETGTLLAVGKATWIELAK
jgi:hypothetical protein